jgi:chromosome segregation ATPase
MADITLLHQEITLLKLRIAALEHQRNNLESELAVAVAERDQADVVAKKIIDDLKRCEAACRTLELEVLRERRTSNAAMAKIEQLENELEDAFSDDED